ncbi:MAG TPA: nucleotide exchange factor GrpE [Stellaceae bacterium]|nr:nucleotide exchange factor GrpE [Stellaceae bacterium]
MSDERQNEDVRPDGAASPDAVSLEQRVALLEAELAEAKDRLLRALAETENVRRRAERERSDASKYGAGAFAKDLLNVADNLRRALDSVPKGEGGEPMRGLLEGVAATERELLAAFERHGIRRVDPSGERFDHNLHQAMFEVESGQTPGTIVQVLQPGYVMHDRLLRPALVGVAKATKPPGEMPRVDEVV